MKPLFLFAFAFLVLGLAFSQTNNIQTVVVAPQEDFVVQEFQAAWQPGGAQLGFDEQFASVTFPSLAIRARVSTPKTETSGWKLGVVWMVQDDYRKSRWTDAWLEEFAPQLPALRIQNAPWAALPVDFSDGEAFLSCGLNWSASATLKSRAPEAPGALTAFNGSERWSLFLAVLDEETSTLHLLKKVEVLAGWSVVFPSAPTGSPQTTFTMSLPQEVPLGKLPEGEAWNRSVLPRLGYYNGIKVE